MLSNEFLNPFLSHMSALIKTNVVDLSALI